MTNFSISFHNEASDSSFSASVFSSCKENNKDLKYWDGQALANTVDQDKMDMCPAKSQISLGIHPVWSVFAVRMEKAWVLSYPLSAQRRLWSDWADAQADLSLRMAHIPFCWFCHEVVHLPFNLNLLDTTHAQPQIQKPHCLNFKVITALFMVFTNWIEWERF